MKVLKKWRISSALLTAALFAEGCQSTSGIMQPSKDFVAATGALAQAESDYFDQIQSASDAVHRLDGGSDFVSHNGDFASIYKRMQNRDDFSRAKAIRMAVMRQLQNYSS